MRRLVSTLGVCALAAGCMGDGCGEDAPAAFPHAERVRGAVQVRITEQGMGAIGRSAQAIVSTLVPGGLNFAIPPSCDGNPKICCGQPEGSCKIDLNLAGMQLGSNQQTQGELTLQLSTVVKTPSPLKIRYTALVTANCDVSLDTGSSGAEALTVAAKVRILRDTTSESARLTVSEINIQDLDNGDININGGIVCGLADLFKGLFVGQVAGAVEQQAARMVENMVCKTCMDNADCMPYGSCQKGICMINDGGGARCLQELGLTGRFSASNLLGGLASGGAGLDFHMVADGPVDTSSGGMSLDLLAGVRSARKPAAGRCGGGATPPVLPEGGVPRTPLLTGNEIPGIGAVDVGFALHQTFFDQLGYALYESGTLCTQLSTNQIAILTSDTLNLLIPSLTDLLYGESGQVGIRLRPSSPPQIKLSGSDKQQAQLGVKLPALSLDFYAMVDERFVRLFTAKFDFDLKLSIGTDASGALIPMIDDAAESFSRLSIETAGVLHETSDEIASRFPALVSVALPLLTDAIGAIALPEIAGMRVQIPEGGIRVVEDDQFLLVAGNLQMGLGNTGFASPGQQVDTVARIREVRVPRPEVFAQGVLPRAQRPTVVLELGGHGATAGDPELEWQVRVDGGPWSVFRREPLVELSREAFWLMARHRIEVRARRRDQPASLDPQPVVLEALIDPLPPRIALDWQERRVKLDARDAVSPAARLTAAYRIGDGPFQAAGTLPVVLPVGPQQVARLEVQVRDEAGNLATGYGAEMRPPPAAGAGCAAGSPGGTAPGRSGLLAGLLALGALLWSRRRCAAARPVCRRRPRRRPAPGSVVGPRPPRGQLAARTWPALLALLAAGACGPKGGDDRLRRTHVPGRFGDIAADGNRAIVAAYEQQYGDLVVAEVGGDQLYFTPIDGVPDGPVEGAPTDYRGGVKAEGPDVGAWTSAVLVKGAGRIAYQDRSAGALKMAIEGDGTWLNHVVDGGSGGQVGRYAALVVDPAGGLGIAYMAERVPAASGQLLSQLRWAHSRSARPASSADWTIEVVAEAPSSCAGLCSDGQVCVAADKMCHPTGDGCGECGPGRGCVNSKCLRIEMPPVAADLPDGTGLFPSAVFLPDGRPAIAFYDRNAGDLLLARRGADGKWQTETVDGNKDADTGRFASLAVDQSGTLHLAFYDASNERLLYTARGSGSGAIEVVDDGSRDDGVHPVGASATMILESNGQLAIAYQDMATVDLLLARRTGEGSWASKVLQNGDQGFGFYVSAARHGNDVLVSNYVYDAKLYPPGEVRLARLRGTGPE